MSSDFDKDDLDVERHYSRNWLTSWVSLRLLKHDLKHHTSYCYNLAQWLMGFANQLRSASPRDGYEWVDRRKSAWSQMDNTQKVREIEASLKADDKVNDLVSKNSKPPQTHTKSAQTSPPNNDKGVI